MENDDELFGRLHGGSRTKRRVKSKNLEEKLSYQIATYLTFQYPDVIFRFDIAADIKLTVGQANKVKSKLKHRRGFHDLTILEPKGRFHGLLIELKKDRSEVYRKDGMLKKKSAKGGAYDHNQEQYAHLENMADKGYKAVYGFGFEHTKEIIDEYFNLV